MDFDRRQKALKELFAKGDAPADAALFKLTVPEHVKSETLKDMQRKFTFVISSGALDRDGDTVDPHAWDCKSFMDAGGPVLFAHKADQPPVGRTERIYNAGGRLKAEHLTPPRGAYPFADTISDLVDFGALKATSVGFKPKNGKTERNEKGGFDFTGQELLEWSIVPIPSNPEALREAKRADIANFVPLKDWAERVLEETEGSGLWLPKKAIESVLKIASGERVTVALPGKVPAAGAAEGRPASAVAAHAAAGTLRTKVHDVKVEQRGDKWAVVDSDGKVYGTHDSEAEAMAQQAALYANKGSAHSTAMLTRPGAKPYPEGMKDDDEDDAVPEGGKPKPKQKPKATLPLIAKGDAVLKLKAAPPPPPPAAAPAAASPAPAPAAPMTLQAAIDAGAGSIVEAFTNAVQSVADAKPEDAAALMQAISEEFTTMALAAMEAAAPVPEADTGGEPPAPADGAAAPPQPPPAPKKMGRMLSRVNEDALRMAMGVIQDVLGRNEAPKPADAMDDSEHQLGTIDSSASEADGPDHRIPTPSTLGVTNPDEMARLAAQPAAGPVKREPAAPTARAGAPNEGSPAYGKGQMFQFDSGAGDELVQVTPDMVKALVRDTLTAERYKASGRLPD